MSIKYDFLSYIQFSLNNFLQEVQDEQIKKRDKRRDEKRRETEQAKSNKKGSIDAGDKSADLLKGRKRTGGGRLQAQKSGSGTKK